MTWGDVVRVVTDTDGRVREICSQGSLFMLDIPTRERLSKSKAHVCHRNHFDYVACEHAEQAYEASKLRDGHSERNGKTRNASGRAGDSI
jgi:hypothetical protein